jgi:hypothetical protein
VAGTRVRVGELADPEVGPGQLLAVAERQPGDSSIHSAYLCLPIDLLARHIPYTLVTTEA